MPNFKPKAKKKIKIKENSIVTVDNKHQEMMNKFENDEKKIIPKLKKNIKLLKKKIKNNEISLDEKFDLDDTIKNLKKKVNELRKEKKKYFLDNSEYVFNYYENKQILSEDNNNDKKKILHAFFNPKTKKNTDDKKNVLNNSQKYLNNIDESFFDINFYVQTHEICNKCGGELVSVESEGVLICKKCSQQVNFLIEHEKPSYKEPPKEVCFYAYKRINHFREILAQFQAKETTQIPKEVIDNIILQIKKERITLDSITNKRAKDILKKLGYNKYYEHIPFIKDKLGIKPPIMKQRLEETLCSLFMDIQKPYAKHCPDDRVNFLNYYYVLFKMCELLGETQFLPYFPMLKDPVKRIEQDEIWKKICKELHWEFVPTI
jgi:hypothetical protein|tara:strand:+ start:737 stop:1864 length:1128 start_codon:yes stop_codon:yes gene_type:complete